MKYDPLMGYQVEIKKTPDVGALKGRGKAIYIQAIVLSKVPTDEKIIE